VAAILNDFPENQLIQVRAERIVLYWG